MKSLFRLVNGLYGVGMILFGVLLAQQSILQLSQPAGSDAFTLIQFHFALTGFFSCWALLKQYGGRLLAPSSLLLLGVNGWIACLAIITLDAERFWPISFLLVSAIQFSYLLLADKSASDESSPQPDDESSDGELLIPANFGVSQSGGRLKEALVTLGAMALTVALISAILFFGAIYATLLKSVIFDDTAISFGRVYENLARGAGDEALSRVGIAIVLLVAVYGFIFVIEAAIARLVQRKSAAMGIDPGRDLTREERVYASASVSALAEYLDNKEFAPIWRGVNVVGVAGLIVGFIAAPAALIWLESAIDAELALDRAGGIEPIYYSGALFFGAAVGGFVAGALLFWSLFQFFGARFPEFGEYLFARVGWNSLNNRPRVPYEFLLVLVRHIRNRILDIGKPFDPSAFLHASFREHESIVYKSAILSGLMAGALTFADVSRFELVNENGVYYSRYFELNAKRVTPADLDGVELRCALLGPDDDGKINLRMSYILVEEGEFRIDLLGGSELSGERLKKIESLDSKLSALEIPLSRAKTAGFLQGGRPSFIETCAAEIAARHDAEIAKRLIDLLRVKSFAVES